MPPIDDHELAAHLARYGIPMPEDEGARRHEQLCLSRWRMESVTRRCGETAQEQLFWPERKFG